MWLSSKDTYNAALELGQNCFRTFMLIVHLSMISNAVYVGIWSMFNVGSQSKLTCSITSGAIQHGVPTNVFLTLCLVTSPPVDRKALTPKSIEND